MGILCIFKFVLSKGRWRRKSLKLWEMHFFIDWNDISLGQMFLQTFFANRDDLLSLSLYPYHFIPNPLPHPFIPILLFPFLYPNLFNPLKFVQIRGNVVSTLYKYWQILCKYFENNEQICKYCTILFKYLPTILIDCLILIRSNIIRIFYK